MMETIQSIILGLVQGLGEFLPISSSAHLIIIPKIFNWPDQGLAFDVALHLGTLTAVLIYFWKDWMDILKNSFLLKTLKNSIPSAANAKTTTDSEHPTSRLKSDLLFIIILSTLPGIASGLFLEDYAQTAFRNPLLVAITLSAGAILLFYADRNGKKSASVFTLKAGLLIGVAQALAIIPGISRSGITITAALILGFDRVSAARFSFLLSTPIILGAGIKEVPHLLEEGLDVDVVIGAAVAAISGYLAIKYLLKYLETKSYNIFVIYRFLLAALLLILFLR